MSLAIVVAIVFVIVIDPDSDPDADTVSKMVIRHSRFFVLSSDVSDLQPSRGEERPITQGSLRSPWA